MQVSGFAIFLLVIQTLAILALLGVFSAYLVIKLKFASKLVRALTNAMEALSGVLGAKGEEGLGKELRETISEVRGAVAQARELLSRISEIFEAPFAITRGAKSFFEESARATREKASQARTLLSAILQGIYQGFLELKKPGSGSAKTEAEEKGKQ